MPFRRYLFPARPSLSFRIPSRFEFWEIKGTFDPCLRFCIFGEWKSKEENNHGNSHARCRQEKKRCWTQGRPFCFRRSGRFVLIDSISCLLSLQFVNCDTPIESVQIFDRSINVISASWPWANPSLQCPMITWIPLVKDHEEHSHYLTVNNFDFCDLSFTINSFPMHSDNHCWDVGVLIVILIVAFKVLWSPLTKCFPSNDFHFLPVWLNDPGNLSDEICYPRQILLLCIISCPIIQDLTCGLISFAFNFLNLGQFPVPGCFCNSAGIIHLILQGVFFATPFSQFLTGDSDRVLFMQRSPRVEWPDLMEQCSSNCLMIGRTVMASLNSGERHRARRKACKTP
jgi:hypothetical protein